MKRILLVRHGESEWNAVRRLQGQADIDLSQKGRRQAAALAPVVEGLAPDLVLTSDLKRAADTAALLGYPQAVREQFLQGEHAVDGHPHVHGANMGFSAVAYRQCGGFAPLATGEDVALIQAMHGAGMQVARLASPRVMTSARRHARAPHGFSEFLRRLEQRVGLAPDDVVVGDAAPLSLLAR